MRQAGRYLPEYREIRARAGSFLRLCLTPELAAEVTVQPVRRYGLDAAILFSDILVIPYALGQPLDFLEGEGPRLEPLRTAADIAALDRGSAPARLAPICETVRQTRSLLPPATALIGFAGAPWTVACYMVCGATSRDWLPARQFALTQPTAFRALLDLVAEATIDYLTAQVEAGAEVLQLFESWAGAVAAGDFADFVIVPTRRIVSAIKRRYPRVPIIGFPRGAGLALPDYAVATGIDGVSLDTGVPLDRAKALVPDRIALQGNLDPAMLLVGGAPMAAAVRTIRQAMAGRPFVFNLGHGILPQTPPDHVAALVDLVRQPIAAA